MHGCVLRLLGVKKPSSMQRIIVELAHIDKDTLFASIGMMRLSKPIKRLA